MKYCVVITAYSGPVVYGPFDEFAAAEQCAQEWRNVFDGGPEPRIVEVLVIHPVTE